MKDEITRFDYSFQDGLPDSGIRTMQDIMVAQYLDAIGEDSDTWRGMVYATEDGVVAHIDLVDDWCVTVGNDSRTFDTLCNAEDWLFNAWLSPLGFYCIICDPAA